MVRLPDGVNQVGFYSCFSKPKPHFSMNLPDPDIRFKGRYRIPSTRLAGYDYGAGGMYFITICTKGRFCFFGTIDEAQGELCPTLAGQAAIDCWQAIPDHFPFVGLDTFQVMPNHIHGILWIDKPQYTDWQPNQFGPQRQNLASVVRGFKIGVTKQARLHRPDFDWQPRYHDRVIRDDNELNRIRTYIEANPANWQTDQENQDELLM